MQVTCFSPQNNQNQTQIANPKTSLTHHHHHKIMQANPTAAAIASALARTTAPGLWASGPQHARL